MFQSYVMLTMATNHWAEVTHSGAIKLMERIIHSGYKVFVEKVRRDGNLSEVK